MPRGRYMLPLKPGRYMVELKREGFTRQVIGVTIPENEGRKIAAWMVPQQGRANPLEGANLFEMSQAPYAGKSGVVEILRA